MVQSTTHRAFLQGTLRLFSLFALGASVLTTVHVASRGDDPASASEVSEADKNSDNQVDAKDLILLLQEWTPGEVSVSEMLQMGQSWQSGDPESATFTATHTATSTDTPCDTFTYTPTPTPEADTATFTPRPTGTPTPTAVDPELFYYYQNRKVFLTPSGSRIAVAFIEGTSSSERAAFLSRYPDFSSFYGTAPLGDLWRIDLSRSIPWNELKGLLDVWAQDQIVRYVTFSVVDPQMEIYVLDRFRAKVISTVTPEEIEAFNELNQVEVLESGFPEYRHGRFVLRPIGIRNSLQTIRMANLYHENGMFEYSTPDMAMGPVLLKNEETIGAQFEYYYYYKGKPKPLNADSSRVGIQFREDLKDQEISQFVLDKKDLLTLSIPKTFGGTDMKVVNLNRLLSPGELADSLSRLSKDPRVKFCSPVFRGSCESEMILTGSFRVKFSTDMSTEQISSFIHSKGIEVQKSGGLPHRRGRYLLTIPGVVDGREILKKANELVRSGKVQYASPDFMISNVILSPTPIPTPNDTYFGDQWHLQKIDALYGWALETGDNSVVIAIIDTGIDLDHPDLDSHIWVNSDEIPGNDIDDDSNGYVDDRNGYNFVYNNGDPDDDHKHGTCCAGLAAAESNNSAGVAGVSWNSKVMAIKLISFMDTIDSPEAVVESFEYAADNGAHVISCSWHYTEDDGIDQAIQDARMGGRDGKGCVVVFASGNNSGYVTYPGYLDQVVAVGATNNSDVKWDDSSYGDPLDVMAPSNFYTETLVTTDIQDYGGYNYDGDPDYADLDYTKFFGGTSGACPQVAGLAALLLSQNPNLTAGEVQSLIQASADDKGTAGWDEQYGWGRINVYKALATATPGIGRYEIRDEALGEGVAFDEHGYLYLSGRLKGTQVPWPDYTPIPTPNPNKTEFVIRNANQTPVALVDIAEGDLYIRGTVNTRTTVPTPNPNKGEFYIRNAQSTPVALINEDGDLYLKGQYYNESYP